LTPPGPEESPSDPERLLAEAGASLCELIVRCVPGWVGREVDRVVEAWARASAATSTLDRAAVHDRALDAGRRAGDDVAGRLGALLSADLDAQVTTPLEIVRGAVSYPTAVLRAAGVPPVERDRFAEEHFPDDPYGLTPASLAAVDPALAEPALAWGAAKAMAHRRRHGPSPT
jgi:hypothetical protein